MIMVNTKIFKARSQIKLNYLIWIESKYLPINFQGGGRLQGWVFKMPRQGKWLFSLFVAYERKWCFISSNWSHLIPSNPIQSYSTTVLRKFYLKNYECVYRWKRRRWTAARKRIMENLAVSSGDYNQDDHYHDDPDDKLSEWWWQWWQ